MKHSRVEIRIIGGPKTGKTNAAKMVAENLALKGVEVYLEGEQIRFGARQDWDPRGLPTVANISEGLEVGSVSPASPASIIAFQKIDKLASGHHADYSREITNIARQQLRVLRGVDNG